MLNFGTIQNCVWTPWLSLPETFSKSPLWDSNFLCLISLKGEFSSIFWGVWMRCPQLLDVTEKKNKATYFIISSFAPDSSWQLGFWIGTFPNVSVLVEIEFPGPSPPWSWCLWKDSTYPTCRSQSIGKRSWNYLNSNVGSLQRGGKKFSTF